MCFGSFLRMLAVNSVSDFFFFLTWFVSGIALYVSVIMCTNTPIVVSLFTKQKFHPKTKSCHLCCTMYYRWLVCKELPIILIILFLFKYYNCFSSECHNIASCKILYIYTDFDNFDIVNVWRSWPVVFLLKSWWINVFTR